MDKYTKEDLIEALHPVSSVISKCEKAQLKFEEGTSHYNRFNKLDFSLRTLYKLPKAIFIGKNDL